MKWTVLDNPDEVAREACRRIVQISADSIQRNGSFSIVLAGGTTPAATYALLAKEDCEWEKWHVWFGDERCLPREHADRNSLMAKQTLTGKVPIPPEQVHEIPAELGAEEAASQYANMLRDLAPFDIVLLGMGEDGHTASLFPGSSFAEESSVVAVFDAPKPPPERVSLSPRVLGHCHHLIYIITGKGKAAAVQQWQRGDTLPVAGIESAGKSEVLIDQEAIKSVTR